jgi:hypothetical protein
MQKAPRHAAGLFFGRAKLRAYSRSQIVAIPWPPPMHIVHSA